jgi:hypothetical protein
MDNHYHLVIETREANLAKGMRQLNGVYTRKCNWRCHKTGHIFQGRHKAIIVDRDPYLLELCRYVALNPVRAHAAGKTEDWKWSSYRATAGIDDALPFLSTNRLLARFSATRKRAFELYRIFVAEGISGRRWGHLHPFHLPVVRLNSLQRISHPVRGKAERRGSSNPAGNRNAGRGERWVGVAGNAAYT